MCDVVIKACNLNVEVQSKKILKDVSFSARKGEVMALLGGNGAGKSTTLKTFLGLMKATSGQAILMGQDVHSSPEIVRQKVAYLPESVMLYGHLSAFENLRYFLSLSGNPKSDDVIASSLERVALQEAAWHA